MGDFLQNHGVEILIVIIGFFIARSLTKNDQTNKEILTTLRKLEVDMALKITGDQAESVAMKVAHAELQEHLIHEH